MHVEETIHMNQWWSLTIIATSWRMCLLFLEIFEHRFDERFVACRENFRNYTFLARFHTLDANRWLHTSPPRPHGFWVMTSRLCPVNYGGITSSAGERLNSARLKLTGRIIKHNPIWHCLFSDLTTYRQQIATNNAESRFFLPKCDLARPQE